MSSHPFAAYWNRGVEAAPQVTGAARVMDCRDLVDACRGLGVDLPLRHVLDVGCGTGRFSQCCEDYLGVDIAADQVAYAQQSGVRAALCDGPKTLVRSNGARADWVTCFSVFTHIDRAERQAYLAAFALCAPRLLVDVIPGDGSGDVALWTADWPTFLEDLATAGWQVVAGPYDRTSPDGVIHRYVAAGRES